jgi:hypothetical protein
MGKEGLKKVRIVLIIISFLLLVSLSLARPEILVTGPYKITFDPNITEDYRINNISKQGETYCGIKYQAYTAMIIGNNSFVLVTVIPFTEKVSKDINDTIYSVEDFLYRYECDNVRVHERVIDNQSGIVGIGENSNGDFALAAEYWLMLDKSCDTNVLIESTFPWDKQTLSLLNTIHVELIRDFKAKIR